MTAYASSLRLKPSSIDAASHFVTAAEIPTAKGKPDGQIREHFPAASAGADTYTLAKFYDMSHSLIKSVLKVGFPHASLQSYALLSHNAACLARSVHAGGHSP